MSYLDTRITNFNQFRGMIDHPDSKQCGSTFTLVDTDARRTAFQPTLRYLGAGSYGIAFALDHDLLSSKNINVVLKVANTANEEYDQYGRIVLVNHNEALDEIYYNLLFSKLVENGRTRHFPLFSKCKRNPVNHILHDEPQRSMRNCDCGPIIHGNNNIGCSFALTRNQQSAQNLAKVNDNDILTNGLRHGCLVSFSEKYDGDIHSYLISIIEIVSVDLSENEKDVYLLEDMMTITVQIIFALSEMHKKNLSHSDSHTGNIFYKRLQVMDTEDFVYDYEDDGEYNLTSENRDMLCILADFGLTGKKIINGNAVDITPFSEAFFDRLKNNCDQATRDAMNGATYRRWKRSALYDLYRFMTGLLTYGLNPDQSIRYPHIVMFTSRIVIFLYNKIKSLELYPIQQAEYDPLTFLNDIPSVLHENHKVLWDNKYAIRVKKCDSCDAYNFLNVDRCSGCGKNLCKGGICGRLYKRFFGLRPKKTKKSTTKTMKKKSATKTKKSTTKTMKKKSATKTKKSSTKTKKSAKKSKRSIRHKK